MGNNLVQKTILYHEETKHSPYRYAKSSGFMDWENQPEPFRVFEGCPALGFPLSKKDSDAAYTCLYERGQNHTQEIMFNNIGAFIELSMGISAWKSFQGSSWALRMNPSSGNLHPTELYLILPPMPEMGNKGGVFHYNPYFHALFARAGFDAPFWDSVRTHFNIDGFFVGLSSIFWRESWKYGERAFRYCNHDVGHAMACLSLSANLLGWRVTYLNTLSSEDIETMLGFSKTKWVEFEKEHPDLLLFVCKNTDMDIPRSMDNESLLQFRSLPFVGKPNPLSGDHVDWNIIDQAALWTEKPRTDEKVYRYNSYPFLDGKCVDKKAAKIIRQRRSGQTYDGETSITREEFLSIMDRTMPRDKCAPFDLELGEVSVHMVIFVHRVTDMDSGLYFLVRNEDHFEDIKSGTDPGLLWEKPDSIPDTLPLYILKRCDCKAEAQMVSCDQDIAGDSSFSVGMIARFRGNIEKAPYLYRHLFWETGMVGQVLYLEAEAYSVRGTGIGCFYDDLVHQLLGFRDNSYQSLYHFTVGGSVEDERLTTLPPYHHLEKNGK